MFNHILVGIDESASSKRAFEVALELAKDLKTDLILVHALDVFDPASPERPTISANSYSVELDNLSRKTYERRWAEFVQHYESLLTQDQQVAEAMGISASYRQPYGRPGPAICKVAKDNSVDLIIVGSHGRKGLSEVFLGSISNHVMHHAPCSVMVMHPDSHHGSVSQERHPELSVAEMSA